MAVIQSGTNWSFGTGAGASRLEPHETVAILAAAQVGQN